VDVEGLVERVGEVVGRYKVLEMRRRERERERTSRISN